MKATMRVCERYSLKANIHFQRTCKTWNQRRAVLPQFFPYLAVEPEASLYDVVTSFENGPAGALWKCLGCAYDGSTHQRKHVPFWPGSSGRMSLEVPLKCASSLVDGN
jgi:hypothetical protein